MVSALICWQREYIHRVGRTARGDGGAGKALLFLLPSELGFLRYLKDARVPLNEYDAASLFMFGSALGLCFFRQKATMLLCRNELSRAERVRTRE